MNIYWFKRDLRLTDLDGLIPLLSSKVPLLLLYIYEPSLWENEHYSLRHETFVKQSLVDMNLQLEPYNTKVLAVEEEAFSFFTKLIASTQIHAIHSARETGIQITYERDIAVARIFKQNGLPWNEFQTNGVFRGFKNRDTWSNDWFLYMNKPIQIIDFKNTAFAKAEHLQIPLKILNLETSSQAFQKGGSEQAAFWIDSFFEHRMAHYGAFISKPLRSRLSCSRLSPYISWGNVSIRELYQRTNAEKINSPFKKSFTAFMSRLRWQSHFVQKFEQEPRMEFEAINKGYLTLQQPRNEEFIERWKNGTTGYPLVDASMRAVKETGYLNFRMRCLVTSFLCHHLFQHFTTGSAYLAAQFLDFETGIHYSQFQMQSGLTGTNTLRIYNPTKGAQDHDPEALFIKHFVPELRGLSARYAIEPWLLNEELNEFHDFNYGVDYPSRIVDIAVTRKYALDTIYGMRKNEVTKVEKTRILSTHSMKRRKKQ